MNLPDPVSQAARWTLLVGLAFFSADATSALIQRQLQVPPKPLPQATVGVVQDNVPAQAAPPGLVSLLKTTEPEAVKNAAQTGTSVKAAPVVVAPTNLKLRGTMAGGGGSGLAMIDFNGQTQVVSVGEEISNFALTNVTPYSVRLEAGEQVFTLEMDSNGQGSSRAAVPQRRLPPQPRPRPAVPANPTPTPQPNNQGAILTQRELRNILDNPEQLKGFKMKPVLRNGEIIGMRVSIKDSSHPLSRLGIQNGDVVKTLNGKALNGPEALSGVYRILRNSSSLSFEVDRGGASQKVDVALEE